MKKSLLSLVALLGLTAGAMAQAPSFDVPKSKRTFVNHLLRMC